MDAIEKALRILGLDPEATPEEINQAYRDLAMVWHPDRFPSNSRLGRKAEENLKEINEAHRVLRNCGRAAKSDARDDRAAQPRQTRDNDRAQSKHDGVSSASESSAKKSPVSQRSLFRFDMPSWAYVLGPIVVVIAIIYVLEKSSQVKRLGTSNDALNSQLADEENDSIAPDVRARREEPSSGETSLERPASLPSPNTRVQPSDPYAPRPVPIAGRRIRWLDEPQTSASDLPILTSPSAAEDSLRAPSEQATRVAPASFTVGSTGDEVRRLQGSPTKVVNDRRRRQEVWRYGSSSVEISTDTGRVTEFENAGNLKVSSPHGSSATTSDSSDDQD